jgi:hypothetical protein
VNRECSPYNINKYIRGNSKRYRATILVISESSQYRNIVLAIGIRYDRNVGGHTLGGRCEGGHGWWVGEAHLYLMGTGLRGKKNEG